MQIRMKCPTVDCAGILQVSDDDHGHGYDLPMVIACGDCGTGFTLAGGHLRIVSERRPIEAPKAGQPGLRPAQSGTVVARALP